VAGGDGTVAAVAGVTVERDLPLVGVPTGTLNHFARDLGLDLDRPLAALDALTSATKGCFSELAHASAKHLGDR
jgi:diacylglycerol kinase family enzyme